MLELVRIYKAEFDELRKQWAPYFDGDQDLLYDHCRPHLDHAERICNENPPDATYGIYALVERKGHAISYEGFTHINHKLPRTTASEVRLVWNTLHPKFENDLTPEHLASFTVSYIVGAIKLAKNEMAAESVRVYLGNGTDRRYAEGIAAYMKSGTTTASPIAMKGNWLHIGNIRDVKIP